ncbi:putative glu-tRNAGln amidotransferase C subunit, glu-tRNAGln amidotransferase superfamily, subunit C [Septoria linicola]|nr:putative glu-tRNAGln amidotransferase C subunit, glu-tRNAGln amidotransferase superfamily, subunit C [Septoria linicola]
MQVARTPQRITTLLRTSHVLPCTIRAYSQKPSSPHNLDITRLLSTPTWSIQSLLPTSQSQSSTPQMTSKQLHHLLRLSALPPPTDLASEEKMLSTLSSQLHFVKDIQNIDTSGVEPLRSLRDETVKGEKDAELGLEKLKEALGSEEVRGKWHRRVRRRRDGGEQEERWDVLGTAEKRVGRYFVVEGGKEG